MLHIKPLPVDLQKVAEIELGEVPERIPDDLKALRLWIEEQPHLKARLDEQFLIQFLRYCKYDLEKAKQQIKLFFTLKAKLPEFCNITHVMSKHFRELYSYGFCTPLPIPLNGNGPRIYFIQFNGPVAKGQISLEADMYPLMNTMQEIIIMEDPYACINGFMFLADLSKITPEMAAQYTPEFLTKIASFYEKYLPLQVKGVHYLNPPAFFDNVVNYMKSLVSEKLKENVTATHGNFENIYKIIPKKYFPIDFGGENGSLEELRKEFDKKWLKYENYFLENSKYGTN